MRALGANTASRAGVARASAPPAQLPLLTNVWQIRDLSPEQAAWRCPIRLRGQMTVNIHANHYFFFQDETAGISVETPDVPRNLNPGDLVEIEGVSAAGRFSPIVEASNVTVVGALPLPEARTSTLFQLATGYDGSQWIEVRGVVRTVTFQEGLARLTLSDNSGTLPVLVPAASAPNQLLDATVSIRGACGSEADNNRQFLGALMYVSSLDFVQVEEPGVADPLSQPAQPIASIGQFRPRETLQHRLTVAGVVSLCESERSFFIQDSSRAVRVLTSQTNELRPGDYVVVAGYPALDDFGHLLRDAVCRVLNQTKPPTPDRLPPGQSLEPRLHDRWVSLEARFLNHTLVGSRSVLTLQCGERIFEAHCPVSLADAVSGLPPGSLLQLTGVYRVLADEARQPSAFQLCLSARPALQVLQSPSWWTFQHTAAVVGALAAILAATSLWVVLLQRKVHFQTASLQRSERQFRSLVEQSLVGVSILQEGQFAYANPRQAEMYGGSVEQMLRCPVRESICAEDWPLFEEELRRALAGEGQIIHFAFRGRRRDGAVVHVELLGSRTEFAGRPALLATALDITERKRAEAALAEASSLLQTLLDHSPDCIYFKDAQSRFVRVSKSFERQFKVPDAGSLLGKTDFDFFLEEHARPAFEDEQEIIRTGRPLIGKLERETYQDGRLTWALTTKMPWRDRDGKIIGTFGISKDVTAIKEAEAKLAAAHQGLVEASRLAGMAEVATDLLHNVGNVLNSVTVSCSVTMNRLRASKVPNLAKVAEMLTVQRERLGEFLTTDARGRQIPAYLAALAGQLSSDHEALLGEMDQVIRHVEHINQIVAMQQSYTRVSGLREEVNVNQMVEDALQINEAAFARHQVQVVRELRQTAPMVTERHKVLQILVNLIRNATDATDAVQRADKQIRVTTGAEGGQVKIQVSDNGIGISAENLTRIFGHGFTTRPDGHGFGLHSSALAARDLGGSLQVHSDGPGLGATFTLLLPHDSGLTSPAGVNVSPPAPSS